MKRLLPLVLCALALLVVGCVAVARTVVAAPSLPTDAMVVGATQQLGEVVVVGRSLEIRGTVRESVLVVDGDLTVLPGGRVGKDVAVLGGQVTLAPGARVGGAVVQAGDRLAWLTPRTGLWLLLAYKAATALLILLGGLLAVVLFPRRLDGVGRAARAAPLRIALAGLLGYLVAALAVVLLAITVIGLPLALALLVATLLAGLAGVAGASLAIGERLQAAGWRGQEPAITGLGILALLSLVPVLGEALLALLGVLGLGAVLVALAAARRGYPGAGTTPS